MSFQSKVPVVTTADLLISLGIIYGDIGTSPLYVMKAIIGKSRISETLVYSGISCVFWTLTLQTTLKYVLLTLQADNSGEGGIFSLYNLIRRRTGWLIVPAMIGVLPYWQMVLSRRLYPFSQLLKVCASFTRTYQQF